MRYNNINPELFIRNRKKLLDKIKPGSLAIVHSNDKFPRNGDQKFPFRQNSDLFYLTGLDQEDCILCLCPDHPQLSLREVIFTIKPNPHMVTWNGHKYSKEEASAISGVKSVKWLEEFKLGLKDMALFAKRIYLNANENTRFFSEINNKDIRFSKKMRTEYPGHKFKRLAPLITELRMVKEPEEIKIMQKACDITNDAFLRVLKFVKPGVMEYEVEAEMTHEFIRQGAGGHAYQPIVASGINSCILHYCENDKVCKDGDLLLMDFGAEYANYASDCSRTIPVNGRFSPRQRECYDSVLRVFKEAIKMLVPGITIDKFNTDVNKIMEKEMIRLGLFTREDVSNQEVEKPMYFNYFMHGTGHFIGLDVHDVGTKQTVLKKGMVLTCEPGIYIPDENIGIRIENNIVVGQKPLDLMKKIPVEPDEIEKLMDS